MAERASLKRINRIVNQGAVFGLILFSAACGSDEGETPASTAVGMITAPIIWQTGSLKDNLSALAIANAGQPQFLMGFESGGLQIVDFDGAPISEQGPFRTSSVGSGTMTDIGGASLVMFPSASRNADSLVLFVYNDGLPAPAEVALDTQIAGSVQGVCASPADHASTILNVAYWTDLDNSTLVRGRVRSEGENLIYEEVARLQFEKYITACDLIDGTSIVAGGFGLEFRDSENASTLVTLPNVPTKLAAIESGGGIQVALSFSGGEVFAADSKGNFAEVEFAAGLSSPAPETVVNLVMSNLGNQASFPNGFLAVESRTRATRQLVFVDRKDLFDQLVTADG